MFITKVTNLGKNLFEFLEKVTANQDTVIVTTKNGNAVMVSEEYLRSLEETCFLLSVPGMAKSVKEGLNTPLELCCEFDWRK